MIKKLHGQGYFSVTPIFKIIINICRENVEFCGKTSKFLPKRFLFTFFIILFK